MATSFAIDVHGLTKRFATKTAVDHVDIAVPEGEVWGFLGPNGSGKTTTIRMLCGLLRPDDGDGTCLGHDVRKDAEQIKRNVGYMTQRFSFWEDLSIRENLEFVARVYELDNVRTVVEGSPQSGLVTFVVRGEHVRHFADSLRAEPGVEYVAFFGALLHVSGHDRKALEHALANLRDEPAIDIEEVQPSLEDVFIQLQHEEAA